MEAIRVAEHLRAVPEARGLILRWILVSLALVALALYCLWDATAERRAVRALAPEQRAALHQAALQALTTACPGPDPSLAEYCRAQARVLLDLPECDAACRELASGQLVGGRGARLPGDLRPDRNL